MSPTLWWHASEAVLIRSEGEHRWVEERRVGEGEGRDGGGGHRVEGGC